MLQSARKRVRDLASVEVRRGELEALPIPDDELDAATLLLVLHHLPDPAAALSEACRALKPGGRLVIADMFPHDREEYRQQMGHVWLGFSEEQMRRLLAGAGFDRIRIVALPVNAAAKGPGRFLLCEGLQLSVCSDTGQRDHRVRQHSHRRGDHGI